MSQPHAMNVHPDGASIGVISNSGTLSVSCPDPECEWFLYSDLAVKMGKIRQRLKEHLAQDRPEVARAEYL